MLAALAMLDDQSLDRWLDGRDEFEVLFSRHGNPLN
jgi:hypothetical protein